jgi:hypothetical protein
MMNQYLTAMFSNFVSVKLNQSRFVGPNCNKIAVSHISSVAVLVTWGEDVAAVDWEMQTLNSIIMVLAGWLWKARRDRDSGEMKVL